MAEINLTPRVITFSGPKEGVGKTSVAMNLALAWANYQKRNVLIIPLDPMCRQEHAMLLGLNPPSMAEIISSLGRESVGALGALLKGKIPISQWGVGVLPLSKRRSEVARMSPDILLPLLSRLSQSFDLFIDVDPYFPMQVFAFDISDLVFWVTNSNVPALNATAATFREMNELHFPMNRFEVVDNLYDMPGALAPKEIEKFFKQMGKEVLSYMPWEDAMPGCANQNKILITEQPNTQWVRQLRVLLGRVAEVTPSEKQWSSSVTASEFAQGSGMLWKTGENAPAAAVPNSTPTGPAAAPGSARTDVPAFWEELKVKVHRNVVNALETERVKISDDAAANQETRKRVDLIINGLLQKETTMSLTREQRVQFINELLDEILGLGPLEELMRDPAVTEIMVNAPDKVFIERAGKLTLTKYKFRNDEQIVQVMKRIVAPLGRRIDESVPLVDARLKDGSRVNAVIAPLAVSGPTLTIRRFSSKPLNDAKLVAMGSISQDCVDFLKACVRLRKDIIISGGTGTGKTTFLNMLSSYIPEDERIVTVEDVAELRLEQDHWVRLESRPPNVEGKGEVTIRDLVKNCLRMRPDRIVVGEVRGSEALDMLQAMNTGHEGSLATIHANTPRDALTRLEAMCLMAGADLPIWALREMISSAVHMVVQLTRFSDGTRKITSVTEITGREENQISIHEIFKYKQTSIDLTTGKVAGAFSATGDPPKFFPDFATHGITVPIEMFWTEEQRRLRAGPK
ncbi:MAG: ATPase, T2SS/T4P/T4SS family [Elusimicrobia bacterium]|nr:ATPase, T2SS/T4P/T4SS family [Elusimicrobiota bacterium]